MTGPLQTVDVGVSRGDTVELGAVETVSVETQSGSVRLRAAYSGAAETHVAVTHKVGAGDLELPDSAVVLTVSDETLWALVPKSLYGSGNSCDMTEYTVVERRFNDGGMELPAGAEVIAFEEGTGIAKPVLHILVPTAAYGGGGE